MFRILTLAAGLLCGTAASQFPEFSQQYLQRLAGAVDELRGVTGDFDRSATEAGLTRQEALTQMSGSAFTEARQQDMTQTFDRFDRLSADLTALRSSSVVQQALQPWRFMDSSIAAAAWEDYKPAVPVTPAGAGFAGAGFLLGAGSVAGVRRGVRALRSGAKGDRAKAAGAGAKRVPPKITATARTGAQARGTEAARAKPRPGLPLSFLTRTNTAEHKVVLDGEVLDTSVVAVPPESRISREGGATDTVIVCVDGRGVLTAAGVLRTLETGEMAAVPPHAAYELRNTGDGPLRAFVVEPGASA